MALVDDWRALSCGFPSAPPVCVCYLILQFPCQPRDNQSHQERLTGAGGGRGCRKAPWSRLGTRLLGEAGAWVPGPLDPAVLLQLLALVNKKSSGRA